MTPETSCLMCNRPGVTRRSTRPASFRRLSIASSSSKSSRSATTCLYQRRGSRLELVFRPRCRTVVPEVTAHDVAGAVTTVATRSASLRIIVEASLMSKSVLVLTVLRCPQGFPLTEAPMELSAAQYLPAVLKGSDDPVRRLPSLRPEGSIHDIARPSSSVGS
jgi:hypothetical protein